MEQFELLDDEPLMDMPSPMTVDYEFMDDEPATYQNPAKAFPARKFSPEEVDQDVRRTLPAVPANVLSGIVGFPGDVESLIGTGVEKVAGPGQSTRQILPTSSDVRGFLKSMTPEGVVQDTLFYEPKTTTGAIVGGTMEAIAPGLKGVRKGMEVLPKTERALAQAAQPARKEFDQTTKSLYDRLKSADVRYDLDAYRREIAKLDQDTRSFPRNNQAGRVINELVGNARMRMPGNSGPDFNDLELARRELNDIIFSRSDAVTQSERELASRARASLDHFRSNAPMTSSSIPQDQLATLTAAARDHARRGIKARDLGDLMDTVKAAPNKSVGEAWLRQGVDRILKNKNLRAGYSQSELAQLRKIRNGGMFGLDKFGVDVYGLFSGNPMQTAISTLGGVAKAAGIGGGAALAGISPLGTAAVLGGTAARAYKPFRQQQMGRRLMTDILVGDTAPADIPRMLRLGGALPWVGVGASATQADELD